MAERIHIGGGIHFQVPYHNVLSLRAYFYEDIAKIRISRRNVNNSKELRIPFYKQIEKEF